MDASAVREEITEHLMRKLDESRFLHVTLMNRIEQRLRTRDEHERYAQVLVHKLEDTDFRSDGLLDRVDRILKRLEAQQERD